MPLSFFKGTLKSKNNPITQSKLNATSEKLEQRLKKFSLVAKYRINTSIQMQITNITSNAKRAGCLLLSLSSFLPPLPPPDRL